MTNPRIDPRTRRLIVSDLTPPIRRWVSSLASLIKKNTTSLDDQEEKNFFTDRVIKSILFSLWQGMDWEEIDLQSIDWEEWIEPVLRSGEASEPFDWNGQILTRVGAFEPDYITITSGGSPYTADTPSVIIVDASGGAVTINLRSIGNVLRRQYYIKCIDDTNVVTVDPQGAETIDGNTTWILHKDDCLHISATASEWSVI